MESGWRVCMLSWHAVHFEGDTGISARQPGDSGDAQHMRRGSRVLQNAKMLTKSVSVGLVNTGSMQRV